MVLILKFGLLGLCALTQLALAVPEPLGRRAISKYTTHVTVTRTFVGPNGHRTKTTTEVVPTVVRTTYKPTKTTTTNGPNPSAGSCASIGDGTYVDSNGVSYTVACDTDFYGGDLSIYQGSSFEDCFPACDKAAGCVAFSWVGQDSTHEGPGNCYLKSTLEPGVANTNVDGAHLSSD